MDDYLTKDWVPLRWQKKALSEAPQRARGKLGKR